MDDKNRASSQQTKKAIEQLHEIDKKLMSNPGLASEWTLQFLGGYEDEEGKHIDGQMDRVEAFGEKTYFSHKQIELIERIHREIVKGEKPQQASKQKINRYKQADREMDIS